MNENHISEHMMRDTVKFGPGTKFSKFIKNHQQYEQHRQTRYYVTDEKKRNEAKQTLPKKWYIQIICFTFEASERYDSIDMHFFLLSKFQLWSRTPFTGNAKPYSCCLIFLLFHWSAIVYKTEGIFFFLLRFMHPNERNIESIQ